jgi:uncharacterized protein YxjI
MRYQYPLEIRFKLLALTPQFTMRDAQGQELMYVRQKIFKLREAISVFADSSRSQQIFTIRADRILDISAQYNFTSDINQQNYGAVKREGIRSIWRASYKVLEPQGQEQYFVKEENPWVKVADGCMMSVPVLGLFSGFLFHPSYIVYQTGSQIPTMRIAKQPGFFEAVFKVEPLVQDISDYNEIQILLSMMMMLLLERQRG